MANLLPESLSSAELAKRYEEALAELKKRKETEEASGRPSAITDENISEMAMQVAQAQVKTPDEKSKPGLLDSLNKGFSSIPSALGKAAGSLGSVAKEGIQKVTGPANEYRVGPYSFKIPDKDETRVTRMAAERPVLDTPPPEKPKDTAPTDKASVLPNDPKKAKEQVKVIGQVTENAIADIDNKKDQSPFASRLKALQDLEDNYWNEYKKNKGRTEFLQAMETIGLAFAQLGAGIQGQRTGVDLSGLKFNRVDWEKKIDTLMEELRQGLQRTSSAKKAIADEQQFKEGQQFRESERKATQAFQASEAAKDRALREKELGAQRAAKQADADEKVAEARRKEIEKQMAGVEAMEQAIAQLESPNISSKSKQELMDRLPALAKGAGVAVGIPEKSGGFLGMFQSDDFTKMRKELEARRQALLSGVVRVRNPQGQVGTIPESQLAAALQQGYTKVE